MGLISEIIMCTKKRISDERILFPGVGYAASKELIIRIFFTHAFLFSSKEMISKVVYLLTEIFCEFF